MGLYGDLPQAKSATTQEDAACVTKQNSWTASSLAPPTRKPALFGAPPSVLRAGRGKPTSATQRQQAIRRESGDHTSTSAPTPTGTQQSFFSLDIRNEYDPARPNDYEEIRRDRERQRVEADREAERQEELRAQKAAQEAAAKAVLAMQQKPPDPPGASRSAPPPGQDREAALALSGEEAFARRAMLSRGGSAALSEAAGGAPPEQVAQVAQAMAANPGARGMDLAAKMMEKMGWKSGLGLGRNKQGIVNPLMVQKTDKRAGTIVNSPLIAQSAAADGAPAPKKPKGGMIMGTPTRVVLLRNMVGPGQVDEDLEDEVANECSKYGQVQSVMIFEVTTPGYPDDQAVRIFVEFERMEQATKSIIDLGGRFFGGRTVSATFFDEDRFDKQDLAPKAGEPT